MRGFAGAACAGKDPAYWFQAPDNDRPPTPMEAERTEYAMGHCWACPIRVACLDWALARNIRDGIWGGLTAAERAELARRGAA